MKQFSYYKEAVHNRILGAIMKYKSIRLNRHIVVFESDDWGSIRTPSIDILKFLINKGIEKSLLLPYDYVDTLASDEDLEFLMETLDSVKDVNGRPAKITLNTCVANPDFEKIRNSNYQEYYWEPFLETLKRYPHHDKAWNLWKEGIEHKLFQPQFHGREHLNFQKWMKLLHNENKDALNCFEKGVYAYPIKEKDDYVSVLYAYDIEEEKEKQGIIKSLQEGLDLFEKIFGFKSKSIIAPCYHWDSYMEDCVNLKGVKYIQGLYFQYYSKYAIEKNRKKCESHFLGEENKNGQIYLTRNCFWEPSQSMDTSTAYCLKQIKNCLSMGVPAIISCHRLNFIGDLSIQNRDDNLKEVKFLLKALIKQYPDIEFLSSDELGDVLYNYLH